MIHGKPFAAATKASHHFVANHHNAELIAQGPHASKIPLWWHQNAIRSHDRFHNNGGDTVSPLNHDGVTQMLKRPLAFLGFVFSMEGRTISIWPPEVHRCCRRCRLNSPAPWFTGKCNRPARRPVVTAIGGQYLHTPRMMARHTYRMFVGIGTSIGEKHLVHPFRGDASD